MKVAVVGSGVSGLATAFALRGVARVVVYEAERRVGGHANTVEIDYDGASIAVDTGFIVFNRRNYPNLTALFERLGVRTVPSDMSFSVQAEGLEWGSDLPGGLIGPALARPDYRRMLADAARFNLRVSRDLDAGRLKGRSLADYAAEAGFSDAFARLYLAPMTAAIWSVDPQGALKFPAESVARFYVNHALGELFPPRWRTVAGGSATYLRALEPATEAEFRTGRRVVQARRGAHGIEVTDDRGGSDRFDHVVFACPPDRALACLDDADAEERERLSGFGFGDNTVVLHRDPRFMPRRRAAWASWNVRGSAVTYWMNRLQGIDPSRPLFVTLEPDAEIAPEHVFSRHAYRHPWFDAASLKARDGFDQIQGRGGVWHAGAWLGYGFHEDGLTSGLRVGLALGGRAPWTVDLARHGGPLAAPRAATERSHDAVAA